jgi:hypothetical protein
MPHDRGRLAQNRVSWSYAIERFNRRKGDFAAAIRRGRNLPEPVLSTLDLGPADRVLHLLCNDGREAAALSFHTGARVDGVDFADDAVEFARTLNRSLRLANTFVAAEAYAFLEREPPTRYDKMLLTPGSIRWLPDLGRFFELCSAWLAPTGTLTVWDFHPLRLCLDSDRRLVQSYPLAPRSYERDEGVRDYAAQASDYLLFDRRAETGGSFRNPHRIHITEYGLGSIISAAVAGRRLVPTRLVELGFSWEQRCFDWLAAADDGTFAAPPDQPQIPLTFLLQLVPAATG